MVLRSLRSPFVLAVLVVPVVAHDLARSESRSTIQGSTVRCQLTVDLLEFPGVDQDGNGTVSYAELDQSIAGIFDRIKEHFVVRGPADPSRVVMTRHELLDEHTARLDLLLLFPANVSRLEVTSTFDQLARRPDYEHYVTTTLGGVEERAILDASRRTVDVRASLVDADEPLARRCVPLDRRTCGLVRVSTKPRSS